MQCTSQKQVRLEVNFKLPLIPKLSEHFLQCLLCCLVSYLWLLNIVYYHLSPSHLWLAKNGIITQKSLHLRIMLAALLHHCLASMYVKTHALTVHPQVKNDLIRLTLQLLLMITKIRMHLAAMAVVMQLQQQDNSARWHSLPH